MLEAVGIEIEKCKRQILVIARKTIKTSIRVHQVVNKPLIEDSHLLTKPMAKIVIKPDDRGQDPDHAEGAEEAEPASGDAGRRNEREDDLKLK